ncbi:MAG: preprotein translocase subunit SecY [Streptococcus salivarius]
MFFKLLKDALKVKNVRNKILFTIFIIFVFRVGTHVTVPGINAESLKQLSDLPFLNMLNLVSGNAMNNFSIFSMGVSPYITASIIVQLLQMDIYPKFVEWGKQGEVGRRKLNQATRYITLVLAFVQSIGITASFNTLSSISLVKTPNVSTYLLIGTILTAGSIIVTWLGEQITDKGFGNGVSMIIFSGIIASIPKMFSTIYEDFFVNVRTGELTRSYIIVALLIVVGLAIVFFTTFVQQAEYQIPIQYTKLVQGAPTSSYLPLKVNPAGVIPIIFASSITTIPSTIIPLISNGHDIPWLTTLESYLNYQTTIGMVIYAVLIVLFSFFYTFVQVNPEKTAENLQKNGSYIPSVRPGRETEKYMSSLLKRLATIGAVFLAFISLAPIAAQQFMHLTSSIALGGTSLLILISTGIEGMKQLEGYLLKRQYVGFMNLED